MPQNSVIVGMSTFPIDMNVDSDRTQLLLPSGMAEITYFLAVAESSQVLSPEETSATKDDNSMIYIAGGAAVAIAAIAATAPVVRSVPTRHSASTDQPCMQHKCNRADDSAPDTLVRSNPPTFLVFYRETIPSDIVPYFRCKAIDFGSASAGRAKPSVRIESIPEGCVL